MRRNDIIEGGIKLVLSLHKVFFIDLFVPCLKRSVHFWRGDRVVEGARLESECAPKGYRGFESLPLRLLSEKN